MRRARERADREIETRRAILPLVVAVRSEVAQAVLLAALGQHVDRGAIDLGIAAAASLVSQHPGVADASGDQAVRDARRLLLVQCQPGDRTDGPGHEEKPVGVARRGAREQARQRGAEDHAGEVVVGQRRMAAVGREQHLVGLRPGDQELAVRERSLGETGVDLHLVFARLQAAAPLVGQAEAPVLLVVARPIGNQLRLIGQRVEVPLQLLELHLSAERDAVVEQVQVEAAGVGDHLAVRGEETRGADVPFRWHDPVEDLRSAGNLAKLERNDALQDAQRLANSVAGDAAADGIQVANQPVHFGAPRLSVDGIGAPPQLFGGVAGRQASGGGGHDHRPRKS